MTKRAPGRAKAAFRLRRDGSADRRRSAGPRPESRVSTSFRFRSTIVLSTFSATAALDELLEAAIGFAVGEDRLCRFHSGLEILGETRRRQQSAGIEGDDLPCRPVSLAAKQGG